MKSKLTLAAFDQTVSDIYEAALNPSHWDTAMTSLINRPAAPPRWDVCFLIWERLNPPTGRFVGSHGVNIFARTAYLEAFVGRFSWSREAHGLPNGQVVISDELTDRDAFKQTSLYSDFLSQWGIERAIIGSVDRSGADRLGLVVPGPDRGDISELMSAIRLYLPHIQRATRISRKIGEADLRAANAEAALDRAPCASIILGDDLEIQYCNRPGQTLLTNGYADVQNGRLRLREREAQKALVSLAQYDDASPSLSLNLSAEGLHDLRALAMRVDQVTAETFGGTIKGGRVVLVAAKPESIVTPELVDRYRTWFDFTPSEARLAATLSRGASLEDYASSYGVSLNAARFLLKGVFGKTGVHKQPQLVALLRDAPDGWVARQETLSKPSED